LNPKVKLIVAVDDTILREYIWTNHGSKVIQYVSELSNVSKRSELGCGVVIYPHVFISAGVEIADLAKISVGSQIHHESHVGEFSVLAPMTLVLGRVHIGSHVFLGSNSSIAPNVRVENRAFVGMSSNVVRNVVEGSKVWGNPAKIVKQEN
jgi:acetyltransferase-like isoleucine patch superfamily enzyme